MSLECPFGEACPLERQKRRQIAIDHLCEQLERVYLAEMVELMYFGKFPFASFNEDILGSRRCIQWEMLRGMRKTPASTTPAATGHETRPPWPGYLAGSDRNTIERSGNV